MDWPDDEFEVFLQQFRPLRPRALPTHRRTLVALVAASAIVATAVIPTWFGSKDPSVDEPAQTPVSVPVISDTPTSPPLEDVKRGGPPLSNAPVSGVSGTSAQRVRVGGAVKPPIKVVHVNPVYPEDAQAAGVEGLVVLEIVIGEDGSVIETNVVRSIPELDQAAIDAVSQWEYETTILNGERVEVEMDVTINFTLSR